MKIPKPKYLLISGISLIFILILVSAALPYILRPWAVDAISTATGRNAAIESLSINPLTLSAEIRGFALKEKDGAPFIRIKKLKVSAAITSIFRRALILDEISIENLAATIIHNSPNRYNFSDIIERQSNSDKKETKGGFLFSLNNIHMSNSSIDFIDNRLNKTKKHTIRDLNIAIPFISNIPYLLEKYVDPEFSMNINGAAFNFYGKTKPMSKSFETAMNVNLKGLDIPFYADYWPATLPFKVVSGKLNLNIDIQYRIREEKKPELGIKGVAGLNQFEVSDKNGAPVLKLPSFSLKADDLEIFANRFLLDDITFDGLELFVERDVSGEWNFNRLLLHEKSKTVKTGTKENAADKRGKQETGLIAGITSFNVRNGALHLKDMQQKGGFTQNARNINIGVRNFSTAPGKTPAEYTVSFTTDGISSLKCNGTFATRPLEATAAAEISGFNPYPFYPYLSGFIASPPRGTIDTSFLLNYSDKEGVELKNMALDAREISLSYGDREKLLIPRFEIKNASFNQRNNHVEIDSVKISSGKMLFSRQSDGTLSLLSLLAGKTVPEKKLKMPDYDQRNSKRRAAENTRKFSWHVGEFKIDNAFIKFRDKKEPGQPVFDFAKTSLALSNLQAPNSRYAPLAFSTVMNRRASLKLKGEIIPEPFHYRGDARIERLPLRSFEAYFPENINVFLLSGALNTNLKLDMGIRGGKPSGRFNGNASIRSFHAADTVSEEDILKWDNLHIDNVRGVISPFSISIGNIALNDVYSRIVILKDGSLNLQHIVSDREKERTAGEAETTKEPARDASKKTVSTPLPTPCLTAGREESAAEKREIRIDAVTIQNGTLSFADYHLPELFATTFYNLGGRVSGLSSEETKMAEVDLRGNLESHSPLNITGSINPLRGDLFADIKIAFRDIELPPVSPYSGTYLGYLIEKGKLHLDLAYRIENRKLDSENRIFIDQFDFGKKVESSQATSLPVKLAVALLKDRKGEIHLDVPVTGRTDDPQFSVLRLVFQVFKNLLVKAATSPFSFISSLLGGEQDFSVISFAPGSSHITETDQKKLSELAKLLAIVSLHSILPCNL